VSDQTSLDWERQRDDLLARKISELGLTIPGSRVERLIAQLYDELEAKDLAFRPTVYLSDQWGCPDGVPLIGVPFYLVDDRLARIEAEMSSGVENDAEAMRYMRHECGHAVNYAFKLFERPDWRTTFGPFSRPYRERYRADPFSRAFVRHILGWYAQKHPDEDFAETFAVWLTPGLDWRAAYAEWPALAKLEYVDRAMHELRREVGPTAVPRRADLPVEAMHCTVREHYESIDDRAPIEDDRQFDGDLRGIFVSAADAPGGEPARWFIHRHYREIISRISYWTGEGPGVTRTLIDHLARRGADLDLRVGGLEAATLVELTAFGTAVVMNHRCTRMLGRTSRGSRGATGAA
jgi:hypothetical protein